MNIPSQVLELLTIQKANLEINPLSLDIFQDVRINQRELRGIIRRIIVDPEIFFLEFTAGVDKIFYLSPETPARIRRARIRQMYHQGYLREPEAEKLLQASDNTKKLSDLLQKYYLLSWTPEEILIQEKTLPGNRKIQLSDALQNSDTAKLRIAIVLNGKYQSIQISYQASTGSSGPSGIEVSDPLTLLKKVSRSKETFDLLRSHLKPDVLALNQLAHEMKTLEELLQFPGTEILKVDAPPHLLSLETTVQVRLKCLHSSDINKIYLQILSFPLSPELESDLNQVFFHWTHWKQTGRWDPENLEIYLRRWREILLDTICERSEEFYHAYNESLKI